MKFTSQMKESVKKYILEKVAQGEVSLSKAVADTFSINQNTVHKYINELAEQGIIERVMRGQYKLAKKTAVFNLSRNEGHLNSDTYAYDHCLFQFVKDLPANIEQIWCYAFSEMTNNVIDHSEAEQVLIIIEQDYLNTTVILADNGIGIFKKIKEHFGFSSLDEAICELFKGKLTTDSANHSGEGIFFSSKLMDKFFILSDGKIFAGDKYENNNISDVAELNSKGTCVVMTLSNFTQKTPKEIFDLYSDDDGSFNKTKIPLKNIFESNPVSRSQAKRLINRLEKFKEIILDFEGITWMGQGFAHQLFVVFQNAHENIKLIPINMNEDVTKMHYHVCNS